MREDKNTTDCFGVAEGPVQQHPVSLQEVPVAVPDGVTQLPDVDGVHHAKASQLVHAQVPVKHLEGSRSRRCSCTNTGAQQLKRKRMQIKIIKLRVAFISYG